MRSRHGGPPIASSADRAHPPSVAAVLEHLRARLGADQPTEAAALTQLVRGEIDRERARLVNREPPRSVEAIAVAVEAAGGALVAPEAAAPPRVINATGVILHTNLGRAPWPRAAIEAASRAATGYGFLELDPTSGRRGPRFRAAEDHLVALTGAADALVLNNAAAALACAVGLAGRRGGVLVSRGELVEIGGGVRIPEIVRRAGARLIEVGTTNRTRAGDFEAPLAEGAARVVLRVHPSNFALTGFTEAPDAAELAELAHRHGAVVIDDLGSGALLETAAFGLAHEPTPRERLDAGSDVVVFSGDKLVGGPQSGLVVGRQDLVARIRRDPLARAMRPDKAILAGVAATLALYRAGRATAEVPVWASIAASNEVLHDRADALSRAVDPAVARRPGVVALESTVGGGSLPGQTLPSWGLALEVPGADRVAAALRRSPHAVLARIEDGRVVLDLRTVEPGDDEVLGRRIAEVAGVP